MNVEITYKDGTGESLECDVIKTYHSLIHFKFKDKTRKTESILKIKEIRITNND